MTTFDILSMSQQLEVVIFFEGKLNKVSCVYAFYQPTEYLTTKPFSDVINVDFFNNAKNRYKKGSKYSMSLSNCLEFSFPFAT